MKVAILAGGAGSRLAEETQIRPKPLVEIGGRPILWHIMRHYAHFGFKDFVIDYSPSGKSVDDVHQELLKNGIFGGLDISEDFPDLGSAALVSVTEIHRKEDIDRLIQALNDALCS